MNIYYRWHRWLLVGWLVLSVQGCSLSLDRGEHVLAVVLTWVVVWFFGTAALIWLALAYERWWR